MVISPEVLSSFSDFLDIIYDVTQEFILRPILFSINLRKLFFSEYSFEFTSFADNATPYECGKIDGDIINELRIIEKVFDWFGNNIERQLNLDVIFFTIQTIDVNNQRFYYRKFQG